MEGFGEIIYRNGDRYKGEFKHDQPWGKGRMFRTDNSMISGRWEGGVFHGDNMNSRQMY